MRAISINGLVVFPDGVRGSIVTFDPESGIITAVEGAGAIEDANRLLFPGFIDIHVHAREYPAPEADDAEAVRKWEEICSKETFITAGEAAINGGVTLYCAMPNDPRPPADERSYDRKRAASAGSPCPVVLFAAVTISSEPWADIPYKIYLDSSPSPVCFTAWPDLENALGRYRGCRVFFHAEDPQILGKFGQGSPRWKTRPPQAEVSAVTKILELTTRLGLRTHICHVSTEKAVRLIAEYNRGSGERVTCEVTPHHLFFSVDDDRIRAAEPGEKAVQHFLDCNPPLRSEHDRQYLIEALRDGLVDVLASDHAPHTIDDKRRGAPGMPHLDTMGPFAGWLIQRCGFSPGRIAQILSSAPARIFSSDLPLPQGEVYAGAAASFTILDLARVTLVEGEGIMGRGYLETRCRWSPFRGTALPSSVAATVVRGKEYCFA
jgi:dihydroorotase